MKPAISFAQGSASPLKCSTFQLKTVNAIAVPFLSFSYFLRSASGAAGGATQQPGSPGWPQQLVPCRSLWKLFLNRRPIFFPNGMGPAMLVRKLFALGLNFLSFITIKAQVCLSAYALVNENQALFIFYERANLCVTLPKSHSLLFLVEDTSQIQLSLSYT